MRFKKAEPLPQELLDTLLNCDSIRQLEPVSVDTLRSVRRHVSATYQVRIHFKQHEALYWIKVNTENSDCAILEYDFLREAHEHFLNIPDMSVLKPVAFLDEFGAMVTQHSYGVPLSGLVKSRMNLISMLWRCDKKIKKNFYQCGKMLAHLHQKTISTGEFYSADELFEYIDVRLQLLMQQSKLDKRLYDRIQCYFQHISEALSAIDLIRVKTHGDYAPYNVLVSDDELVLFDPAIGHYFASLDNYCSQYEDIIHFYKWSQEMFSPYVSQSVRSELSAIFLQGYNENSEHPVTIDSVAFDVFMLKYKVLGVFDTWPSIMSRLSNKDVRIKALEAWFDGITDSMS